MPISTQDVKKIAGLAKLSLTEEETMLYAEEMSKIIGFVEKLNELDLKNIEATSHAVSVTNVFREDGVNDFPQREKAFEQAPARDGSLFKVPRVI